MQANQVLLSLSTVNYEEMSDDSQSFDDIDLSSQKNPVQNDNSYEIFIELSNICWKFIQINIITNCTTLLNNLALQ